MPGFVIVFDEEYDAMMNEALTLNDPRCYFTTLQCPDGRLSSVMYVDGDLYNWSYNCNKFIKVLPLRVFQVSQ